MDEERRSQPRTRAYLPVRLHKTSSPQLVETLTKDVGLGGIRCLSPTLFPVSTEVTVELVLSTGQEPLTMRGRTAWFSMIPESEQFDLGISFFELQPHHQRRLSTFLELLAGKSSALAS